MTVIREYEIKLDEPNNLNIPVYSNIIKVRYRLDDNHLDRYYIKIESDFSNEYEDIILDAFYDSELDAKNIMPSDYNGHYACTFICYTGEGDKCRMAACDVYKRI